jgi:hypothetical protein
MREVSAGNLKEMPIETRNVAKPKIMEVEH